MSAAETDRLHALDAVRGGALILGVLFHATMSYLPGPQIWLVKDPSESLFLSGTFFTLHIFRMTLFFIVAGFFGRMMFHRRGAGGFIKDRLKRIAIPLIAFWPVSMAGIIAGSILAWVIANPGVAPPPPPPTPAQPLGFPLTHLWFLYALLWFYVLTLAVRSLIAAIDKSGRLRGIADGVVAFLVKNPLGLIALIAPFLTAVWFAPVWMAWFGIPTPDQSLIVNTPALAAYGTAFSFGWLLQRQMDLLQVFQRRWPLYLAAAILLTGVCLYLAGAKPVLAPAKHEAKTYLFAVSFTLATWTWAFGLIGAAMRFLSDESPARRYVADASYWIYLVHLPLVVVLQALAGAVDWPWWIEYPLILAIAFPIMLGTYELLVRYSWIGAILNGRRFARRAKPAILKEA